MKILIAGSSGLVGTKLINFLESQNVTVHRLQRSGKSEQPDIRFWDPANEEISANDLEGYDAVIHLGGANIGSRLWTRRRKGILYSSRVDTTRLLAETLSKLTNPPKVFGIASGTGFYGDRGEEDLTEKDRSGEGFLAELSRDWEAAANPAREAGIRVVHFRFGLLLSSSGGVLKRLLPLFKFGMGAVMGSGKQYWPWISLDDAISAINHALFRSEIAGPVNVVAPGCVTNQEFTQTFNSVLNRPTLFKIPTWVLKMIPGSMGQEAFLTSTRAVPDVLNKTGFVFKYPELRPALENILGIRN